MAPIRLIGFVVIVAAMMAGSLWLAQHGGGVSVNGFGYTLTAPAGIAVGALLALLVLTFAFGQLWGWLAGLPKRIQRLRQAKREKQGFVATGQALQALAADDGKVAQQALKTLQNLPEAEPVAQLMEALVFSRFGDPEAARARLQLLTEKKSTAPFAHRVLLAQARRSADWPAVARHAGAVLKGQPKDPQAQADRLQALQHTQDFAGALQFLPQAHKHGVVPSEQQPWLKAFNAYHAALAHTDSKLKIGLLKQATTALPDFMPAWEYLLREEEGAKTLPTLLKAFQQTKSLPLWRLWLAQQGLRGDKLLKVARKGLSGLKETAVGDVALALAAQQAGERQLAHQVLNELVLSQPKQEVLTLLAELEVHLNGHTPAAANWQRQAAEAPLLQVEPLWQQAYRQWQRTYLAGVAPQPLQQVSDSLLLGHV